MELDQRAKIDQACRTAEDFTKLYYESVDRKRHLMSKYYLDSGILVWNGNGVSGKEKIQSFFAEELPVTEHNITSLDAQPVHELAVSSNTTLTLLVAGFVKLGEKKAQPFQQNFMITAQDDKWKIVNDCFRLQEPTL